jgi:hypothetical protein
VSRFAGDRVPTGEVAVTTRNVNRQASALARARRRRRALDKTRVEQDRRVEQATATALLALDTRRSSERSLAEATEALAVALCQLVGREVSIERAAALLELDVTEVRRLTKLAAGENSLKPVARQTALMASNARNSANGGGRLISGPNGWGSRDQASSPSS